MAGRTPGSALDGIDYRLLDLERREKLARRSEDYRAKFEFKVAPTCPPSTAINIHGGRAWNPTDSNYPGRGWTVPNLSLDVADVDDVGSCHNFSNAYYYLGTVVTLTYGYNPDSVAAGDPALTLYGTWPAWTERATAAEAEDDCIDVLWNAANRPWDYGLPLCMLVIRNNGTTLADCQYMPIDAVNRGRSYIWQDCRPRGLWVIGDI